MSSLTTRVYRRPSPDEQELPTAMRFRLYYDGLLRPSQPSNTENPRPRDIGRSTHQHDIRRRFHRQLKYLWQTNPILKQLAYCRACGINHNPISMRSPSGLGECKLEPIQKHIEEQIPKVPDEHGYQFIPIMMPNFNLLCSLDVLILRRDPPGSVLDQDTGDLDNRVKMLIDALKTPQRTDQLGDYGKQNDKRPTGPTANETPYFYTLMCDDKQVSGLTVTTDTLLREPKTPVDSDDKIVKSIISVEIKPYNPTFFNLSFS